MTSKLGWNDISHRSRSLISIDCEVNFIRSVIDKASMQMSESQIEVIEKALKCSDDDIVKTVLYDQFIECLFDSVD